VSARGAITIIPVTELPEVEPGADLPELIAAAADLRAGDVVVVSQKIVSKAEGALVPLGPDEGVAAARRRLARELAIRIVADTASVLVVETAHGLVCANAGVDASNVRDGWLSLLPADPDASARRLRGGLRSATGLDVAVIVADTFGRPWRLGQTDVAIGVAGIAALRDERGGVDRHGRRLDVTQVAVSDEIAAAADLVRRKADGLPVVVVRGLRYTPVPNHDERASAQALLRPPAEDLFPLGRGGLTATLAAPGGGRLTGPVTVDDLQRALAPARRVPGVRIRAGTDPSGSHTVVVLGGPRPLEVGVATGLLLAALADLGYAARHRAATSADTPLDTSVDTSEEEASVIVEAGGDGRRPARTVGR
jgi:coenzyme F420-0:L-glutamate ligase/coenzyme F420-1:gamma-L-glutamate ligase